LVGGGGDDIYIVDSIGDVVRERFFQGTDTVQSSVSWTLGANLENLVLAGVDAINGHGNSLNNAIAGNSADNTLDGGAGNDRLSGGLGNDTYVVDSTGDIVTEEVGAGIDTVRTAVSWTLGANLENLTLSGKKAISGTGNSLNNKMLGNVANNVLSGGSGDDILDGGDGTDTLLGGNGNDTYFVDTATDVITELAEDGVDIVRSSVSFALGANVENLFLFGTAITATGNSLDNVLTGNASSNILQGGGGNDFLDGGDGNDTLVGGVGDDIYVVNTAGDVITEDAGSGLDTVQSSVSFLLSSAANVENLTLTGVSAINGTGNLGNNTIIGNAGSNVIDGGGGIDTLVGGSGNDTYLVDTATDVITEGVGEGIDTVQSSVSFALGDNVENLILADSAITGTGNSLNNVLTGNALNNILQGGGGSDTLVGGSGNDTYLVDTTTDTITELASGGTDTIQSTVSFSLAAPALANVENLILTGTAAIDGTGNLANNIVTGNAGNNVIDGGGGTDVLSGLGGADTFYFSTKGTLGVSTATHISDFNANDGDLIKISRSAFGIASGTNVTIAKITNSSQLETELGSANTFVYDSSNGNLYWNQDGATTTGAGSGGVFAVLDNRADINNSNIALV
jgi:Ca2+-binding RTX toxin-like protein